MPKCYFLILILACSVPHVFSKELPSEEEFYSLVFENDIFLQEDGGYTNGFGMAYGHGPFERFNEDNTPSLLLDIVEASHIDDFEDRSHAMTFLFGQAINTPEDINIAAPLDDQQPYSGLLVARFNFYAIDQKYTDRLGISLGMIGPVSGAESAQRRVHKATGGDDPKGWDHQLKNEPVFRIEAAQSNKVLQGSIIGDQFSYEVTSTIFGGIGNMSSDFGGGAGLRIGRNLDQITNVAIDIPGREVNVVGFGGINRWYVFAEVLGRYVLNDITIEGNTLRESHGVDLTNEQAQFSFGFAFNIGRWAFNYTRANLSRRYETQPSTASFGAVNITYRY
jgi:hypothetical protein